MTSRLTLRFLDAVVLVLLAAGAYGLSTHSVECSGQNPCETQPLQAATGYFVDCAAGDDLQSGLTHLAPWRTLDKVNSTVTVASSDIWIKAGTTCANQQLFVDWSGSASDRAIIGGYVVIGGAAYANTPTGTGPLDYVYSQPRPIIDGTYETACRPSGCDLGTGGAVPSNQNLGLVNVYRNPYVTLQDIEIKDSAGKGILVDPFNSDNNCYGDGLQTCEMNIRIQRVKVHHVAWDAIAVIDASKIVVRDNETGWDNLAGQGVDNRATGFGAGIFVGRCIGCEALIENNYVHDCGGECIGTYFSSFVAIRGNTTANGSRLSIYAEGAKNIVIEQNKVLGGLFDGESVGCVGEACTTPVYGGIVASTECQASAVQGQMNQITIRNNIGANVTGGITYATQFCTPKLVNASGRVAGNTVINGASQTWLYNQMEGGSPTIHADGVNIANNFFAGPSTTNSVCNIYPGFTRRYSFSQVAFNDPECVGTGDVVSSNTGITSGFAFSSASKTNIPPYTEFRPSTSSAAQGNGIALTNTFITGDWSYVRSQFEWEPCGSTKLSDANWFPELWGDYCNAQRTTPIMGALNAQ